MPTASAIFVGVATIDTIALVDSFPGADERVIADEVVTASCGNCLT